MKSQSSQKFLVLSFVLGAVFASSWCLANETEQSPESDWKKQSANTTLDESFRLTLSLGGPRRFATRFLKQNRTFQIRIFPATSKEMSDSQFYDTRYIKRVLIEEQNGEVTLSLQLKNSRMGWLATTQEAPWRIVLDFWSLEPQATQTLEEAWNWQNSNGLNSNNPISNKLNPKSLNSNIPDPSRETYPKIKTQTPEGTPSESIVESSNNDLRPNSETTKINTDTNVFVPLERPAPSQPKKIQQLQEIVGQSTGSEREFDALWQLGTENFRQGEYSNALQIFRKISVSDDRKFKESDSMLWRAAESAFLTEKYESSKDYLRAVTYLHPQSPYSSMAKTRLLDIELIKSLKDKNTSEIPAGDRAKYTDLANSASSTATAQIAASVRITLGSIEDNPESAKLFQQNFNTCVTLVQIPIETQKKCAYILTRSAIEDTDLLSADKSLTIYKFKFPGDQKIVSLNKKLQDRVEKFLNETIKSYKWDSWVAFDKSARKELLNFTLTNPDYTMARARAFSEVGDRKKSASLFNVALLNLPDGPKRNEAASEIANLAQLEKDQKKVSAVLLQIKKSESRKTEGLSSKSVSAVRTLALSPFNNSLATDILLDEMKFGRYSENELAALMQLAKSVRRKPSAENIAQKILQYPAKSQADVEGIQKSLLQYASDLGEQNRLQKSAEIYLAVANLAQGNKKGEAAYKAGVSFARAGLFEKAKESWQSAVSDLNDKRYSALANERLERLR